MFSLIRSWFRDRAERRKAASDLVAFNRTSRARDYESVRRGRIRTDMHRPLEVIDEQAERDSHLRRDGGFGRDL